MQVTGISGKVYNSVHNVCESDSDDLSTAAEAVHSALRKVGVHVTPLSSDIRTRNKTSIAAPYLSEDDFGLAVAAVNKILKNLQFRLISTDRSMSGTTRKEYINKGALSLFATVNTIKPSMVEVILMSKIGTTRNRAP